MTLSQEASLSERYNYAPHMVAAQEVLDALLELEAWRDAAYSGAEAVTEPEELEKRIATLEEITPCPTDYDDLKSFFEDCVESLGQRWACPEAYDMDLRRVVTQAITRGDEE